MEEDILNYSPTVMFRGTPFISRSIIQHKVPSSGQIFNGSV